MTVPTFLAYCGIAAALRRFRRTSAPFLAILIVDDPEAGGSYESAAEFFFRQFRRVRFRQHSVVQITKRTANGTATDALRIRRAASSGSTIVIWDRSCVLEDEILLFADVVVEMPEPTTRRIRAAFKRSGVSLSVHDVRLIFSETWSRLAFAFPPDRPAISGLRRLRDSIVYPTEKAADASSQRSESTLNDLYGYGDAAAWGAELAQDLADFKSGRIPWSDIDAGLLVSGPPGTGKTLYAEALARTCNVPIVASSAARWQAAGYLNNFLSSMKAAFDEAASKSPCLLFIDEIDTFSDRARYDGKNSDYHRQAVNGLLELLDGFDRRTGVVVVAATNHPDNIDPALLRPGRLGRHYPIALPDDTAREKMFEGYAGFGVPPEHAERFRRATEGLSGADICQFVRDGRRLARRSGGELQFSDILKTLRPTVRIPPEHLAIAAFHEVGHAIVGLELGMQLESILINDVVSVTGTDTLGIARFVSQDFPHRTKTHFRDQIAMLLGGLAAETLIFGEFTAAAGGEERSDLSRATALATRLEVCSGLGETLMVEIVPERELREMRNRNGRLRAAIDRTLNQEFQRAFAILQRKLSALEQVTEHLIETRFLSARTVIDMIRQQAMCDPPHNQDRHYPHQNGAAILPKSISHKAESVEEPSFGSGLDELGWQSHSDGGKPTARIRSAADVPRRVETTRKEATSEQVSADTDRKTPDINVPQE